MRLRELRPEDREPLERLLRGTGVFTDDEVDVALELVDVGLGRREGDGYEFVVAEDGGGVAGYACWGPTPATDGTWDLYWIAVDPRRQGEGVGKALVAEVERRVGSQGGRLVLVETAGKESYAATRAFYARCGYPEHARVRDFYRDGDDKVLHVKRLRPRSSGARLARPGPRDLTVRRARPEEAAAFRALRLRALAEEPTAFLASPEEDAARSVDDVARRLAEQLESRDSGVLVAAEGPELLGLMGWARAPQAKASHRARAWGTYVVPEARGRGVGAALLDALLDDVRRAGGVDVVELAVATTREPARALYASRGFVVTGLVRDALRVDGVPHDEETRELRLD